MAEHEPRLEGGELSSLAIILAQRVIQRWDCYPVQIPDGCYVTIHKPLHERLLVAHLRGELTLGAYALDAESAGRFLVFDADSREEWQRLIALCQQLNTEGAASYLERSRRGGHLWLFFDEPLPGREIRRCSPDTVSKAAVEACASAVNEEASEVVTPSADIHGEHVSQRIKSAISVYEFVGQYVELTESGRGLCPFHDDQTPSFGVNIQGNYWHCFAGCGGGSIIDFWMKYRKCDFQQAVRELAELLL